MKKGFLVCFGLGICLLSASAVQAELTSNEYELQTDEKDDSTIYDFGEVSLKIPGSWEGKYDLEFDDNVVEFYHIASREAVAREGWSDGGGRLFSLCFDYDTEFMEYLPSFHIIGDGADGTYYITLPTDVQGYTKDERILGEWRELMGDIEWVEYHAVMDDYVGNVTGSAFCGAYIIPYSDGYYLEKRELAGMNVGKMQMAVNEIYARRGRLFQNTAIQEYFNDKAWYEGRIKPADFDENVFNEYESANLSLLVEAMSNPPVGMYSYTAGELEDESAQAGAF